MSEADNRRDLRADVSEGRPFTLQFKVHDVEVNCAVLDLSHRGMRVAILGDHVAPLRPGVRLDGAKLSSVRYEVDAQLDLAVAGTADSTPLNEPVFRLLARHEMSRAQLWQVLVGLKGLDVMAGGPVVDLGQISRPPKVPARGLYTEDARQERVGFMREFSKKPLETLDVCHLEPPKLTGNIENLLGSVEVPVGLAGPLFFRGEYAAGMVFAPLATTEGALVASAARGATALTRSGGVTTRVLSQRMLRVPLFMMANMGGAAVFCRWISEHVEEIRAQIGTVSRHANLVSLEPRMLGNMVHVAFVYETGDAAGQNMTTTCTWKACQYMMQEVSRRHDIAFDNFIIEANMSGDKKVNYNSFISGRGTRVMAETFVSEDALKSVLKVSSKDLLSAHHGILAGSIQVGMVGYNANVANTIAAIFTACGQDIASVHESSLAQLHIEGVKGGVYASILLPSLIVGTVGGGTHLANQRDYLEMIDCAGSGKSRRFAEIIAGFCLALDLSTMSAIASGQFASAHEKLGRNRPVRWLTKSDMSPEFFGPGMHGLSASEGLEMKGLAPVEGFEMGSSIITELTARKASKLLGHFPFEMAVKNRAGEEVALPVIAKVKPLDEEVLVMVNGMASMCGGTLAAYYSKFKRKLGFLGCHTRELAIYAQPDAPFKKYLPAAYSVVEEPSREAYALLMERLQGMALMDTADDVSGWQVSLDGEDPKERALDGIAELHSVWYGREEELVKEDWLGPVLTTEDMVEMIPLWESLEVHANEEFPELFPRRVLQYHLGFVRSVAEWWPKMEAMPRTLIHNDFNPRNICLRPTDAGHILCAYDWELATLGIPQHDLAEFLAFTSDANTTEEQVEHYVEYHRQRLEHYTQKPIDKGMWRDGYAYALMDLAVNRFALYTMAHTFRRYGFMDRVVGAMRKLSRIELGRLNLNRPD